MKKLKTLYEISRNILFCKEYYCEYCAMIDFNKYFMRNHIREHHDVNGKEIMIFLCKKCYQSMCETEILRHECN